MRTLLNILLNLFLIINCVNIVLTQSVNIKLNGGQINGQLKIVDGKNVSVFVGIPYAQPPIGELRFRKPVPLTQQTESYDATQWPNKCIQPQLIVESYLTTNYSEDCLYLNIWSPIDIESMNNNTLKAVMFWIHGGGMVFGSASEDFFNGEILSTKGDVVLVTINYRLNVFGFFYTGTDDAPGNVGLWDQALALQWVNDNIWNFGGDPQKITIFGESSGSWSVGLQVLSPITRNMYQNAIMMSGAVVTHELIDDPIKSKTKWLNGAKLIGCNNDSTPKTIECLRNMDANSLLQIIGLKEITEGTFFGIYTVIDGVFVPKLPQQLLYNREINTDANILIGTTSDEGSLFLAQFIDPIKFHPTSPANLSYSEAYQELVNITKTDYFRVKPNGEEMSKVYFTEMSPNTEDYDLLRRTIGIAGGDYIISCPTIYFARKYFEARNRLNVYQYYYNIKFASNVICSDWMGACHSDDLFPVFGLPLRDPNNSLAAEVENSLKVIDFFTNFAKYGYPSAQNGKDWPNYYTFNQKVIAPYFDIKNNMFRNDLKHTECGILIDTFPESGAVIKISQKPYIMLLFTSILYTLINL